MAIPCANSPVMKWGSCAWRRKNRLALQLCARTFAAEVVSLCNLPHYDIACCELSYVDRRVTLSLAH